MIIRPQGTVTLPRTPRSGVSNLTQFQAIQKTLQQLRDRVFEVPASRGGGGSSPTTCAFGEIETWTTGEGETLETHYGLSGIIHCSELNWNIYRMEIDVDTDGTFLMSLAIDVTVNRDDDDEIILPGLETGTQPTAFTMTTWVDETTNYPPNEEPEVIDGLGKIYVPLGRVVITDGIPVLARAGCGNITLGQCGGTLSYARG